MTDDLTTAFAHPSERAKATASGAPLDRISMTEHLREIEIGAFQAERGVRQTVRFDVVVEVETRAEQAADDVDRILSYDTIVEAIDAALEAERVNLLETLASRIADGILAHPLAARVFVRIGKLDRGPYTLGVEIVREAPPGRRRMRLLADQAPHPAVVFLSNETVARDDFAALLDALQASGRAADPLRRPSRGSGAARGPCHAAAAHRPSGDRAGGLVPRRARPALRGGGDADGTRLGDAPWRNQRLGALETGARRGAWPRGARHRPPDAGPLARRGLRGTCGAGNRHPVRG
jgi:dihydroneopterin aldolase